MDITTQTDFDILIVGAGLVGASVACAVAAGNREGQALRIGVVEAGDKSASYQGESFDPRVVALSGASQRFLDRFGAWEEIVGARLSPYTGMRVWDSEGTAEIHFDCREVRQPCLGYIVENSVAVNAIRRCMTRFSNIQLLCPARVVGLQRRAEVFAVELGEGRTVSAHLLIAADGADSKLRSLAGFKTREWDYGHKAIVTTVRTEKSHDFVARQCFFSHGPLAFLPLITDTGDSHYCSIVWSLEHPLAQELMALGDGDFCARLSLAFEHCLGEITTCAERFCLPLRQRHAISYVQAGIALVEDAAHTIHPLAGQGVNLGFLDAEALVEEIQRALLRQLPLSEYSILRRYQRRRMGDNLGMMGTMESFKRMFGSRDPFVRWLRNTGMRELDKLPLLKNIAVKKAIG